MLRIWTPPPLKLNQVSVNCNHNRYTHLTKRKRSRGIPNVATWFGMSAVEHLIQNSINCHSWMWAQEQEAAPQGTKCRRNSPVPPQTVVITDSSPVKTDPPTSLLPSSLHPLSAGSPPQPTSFGSPPCDPVMLHQIKEWDSERSLLEVWAHQLHYFVIHLSHFRSKISFGIWNCMGPCHSLFVNNA